MIRAVVDGRERVGDSIRERRKALGLTQADLAARAGCDSQTVSNWERGVTGGMRNTQVLRGIEKALGWAEGSLRRIYQGGEPVLADPPIPGTTVVGDGDRVTIAVGDDRLAEVIHLAAVSAENLARLMAEIERLRDDNK